MLLPYLNTLLAGIPSRDELSGQLHAPGMALVDLRQWIQQKVFRRGRGRRPDNDDGDSRPTLPKHLHPGFPVLPRARPRAITFSSSLPIQSKNSLCQKLPIELRRMIYVYLSGSRTVHMDLQFNRPSRVGKDHA